MSRERRLPVEAIPGRRRQAAAMIKDLLLDIRLCPWWRRLKLRDLRRRLAYYEGLAEGLRLASPPYPPSDPGKPIR